MKACSRLVDLEDGLSRCIGWIEGGGVNDCKEGR